jgi:hypothetical protein
MLIFNLPINILVAPGKPTKVQASKTCNSIELTWQPPTSNGGMLILHYVIKVKNYTVNVNKEPHKIDFPFEPETTYNVKILARNAVGVGEAENISITTDQYCKFIFKQYKTARCLSIHCV